MAAHMVMEKTLGSGRDNDGYATITSSSKVGHHHALPRLQASSLQGWH